VPDPAPLPTSLRRRSLVVLLASLVLSGALGLFVLSSVAAKAPGHHEQLRFMWAMAGQESGWDYNARNATSGAFGKYQIMPFNWPVWAEEYLGDASADQTPSNQEKVAYGRIRDLYRWLGSWKRVAYWWLTGRTEGNEKRWSSYARGYVKNIMQLRRQAPGDGGGRPPRNDSRAGRGDWRRSRSDQKLRLAVNGRRWPDRGVISDGEWLKVHSARTKPNGVRWLQVVTANGRLGWLRQLNTVSAHRPTTPARWRDINDRGAAIPSDRRMVRPRPR